MKVTCQACSAQYTIADDKVKGRKVKIRCKACQTPIVVDGQNPPAEAASSGQSVAPPALDPFAPETAMANDADTWNVNLSDTDSRTMTTAEVIEAYRSGTVTNDAFVWKDGMADWLPIMDCVELAPLLQGPTDPPAPVVGQTPHAPVVATPAAAKVGGMPNLGSAAAPTGTAAARTASAKSAPAADLFGDIDAAGAESEDIDVSGGARAAAALPVLPGSSAYDDKPTGARNENSVLFSLDAMKAGFVSPAPAAKGSKPSAPKPGAPRPQQPSNPDDPFGMGSSANGLPGGGSPLFTMNANQALLTAPAPPEPKPIAAPVFTGAPGSIPPAGMDDKTKKLVLFGGIGAGAVILLLAGMLIFGGKDKTEASAEGAASAAASAKMEEKKVDAAPKEEPKAEEKKEEPAPAPSAEEKKEEAKPEAAKTDTKAATTSHAATTTAVKKDEPEPAAASNAPPFSKASAISALGAAASSAGGCKKPGGPTGVGKVQVTFAPSGRVTSATVMGPPFAGTAVGGCVAGAFRRAKVPAFGGSPVTVSKSFSIN
ncbi:MAG TPA: zinc-ribbon domain-containing protein [Polyangiaceae bacterium]|nr:zinc-ribbon domain-containing protein [Polyangiaceae bacterium]